MCRLRWSSENGTRISTQRASAMNPFPSDLPRDVEALRRSGKDLVLFVLTDEGGRQAEPPARRSSAVTRKIGAGRRWTRRRPRAPVLLAEDLEVFELVDFERRRVSI